MVILHTFKRAEQKHPILQGYLSEFGISFYWCSIKYEYRTLIDLEGVNVVEKYTAFDEDEDDV